MENRIIDIVTRPYNLLIRGDARTGKTHLAIELIKRLLKAKIPVTVINTTFNSYEYPINHDMNDYKELFDDFKDHYYRQGDHIPPVDSSLLSGMRLSHHPGANSLIEQAMTYLQNRTNAHNSFLFVDEVQPVAPEVGEFIDRVLKTGVSRGLYSVHVDPSRETKIDNFEREIICAMPFGSFSEFYPFESYLADRDKSWGLGQDQVDYVNYADFCSMESKALSWRNVRVG